LYRVILAKRARKGLEKAPEHVRKKSIEALDALQESSAPVKLFDVKRLKGYEGVFRIRIGDWRMMTYEFHKREGAKKRKVAKVYVRGCGVRCKEELQPARGDRGGACHQA
jgi:mRNA-degrading endonuclease RelE of RelBE toxin-antitoxin system